MALSTRGRGFDEANTCTTEAATSSAREIGPSRRANGRGARHSSQRLLRVELVARLLDRDQPVDEFDARLRFLR